MTATKDVVRALRFQASRFTVLADTVDDCDRVTAAAAREEAVHLCCRAAVIEQLFELYNELGTQLHTVDAFTASLRRLA